MTDEQKIFLQVLCDHINGRQSEVVYNANWKELELIGRSQQLSGILYSQCKSVISDVAVQSQLKQAYASQLFYSTNRNILVSDVIHAMNKEKVMHCIVKGYEVMKYYPIPALRSMGDTDFMIRTVDREKVHKILINKGFQSLRTGGDEWSYSKNDMCIEVHDSLVHPHKGNEYLLEYFNNLWNHGHLVESQLILDWNFHFMYLIQHLSGHFLITGVGIRQFFDVAVVAKSVRLDWKCIEKELTKLKLWDFCLKTLSFCRRAFAVVFDVDVECMDEDLYNMTVDKIFSDGIFGFEDEKNREYSMALMKKVYQDKEGQSVVYSEILDKIFPRYEVMKRLTYCKFVNGRKYLLPVAWIWRFVYRSINRSGKIKLDSYRIDWEDEALKQRIEFVDQWGL